MCKYSIKLSDNFKNECKMLSKKYLSFNSDLNTLIDNLEIKWIFGIPLWNNLYKIRVKNTDNNKGKSSGYRVIIISLNKDREIILLSIYSKNDVKTKEKNEILNLFKIYKKDYL
jgi:mRNA-degrading endonuclease RelE of RelBE toxin-antitoxin system